MYATDPCRMKEEARLGVDLHGRDDIRWGPTLTLYSHRLHEGYVYDALERFRGRKTIDEIMRNELRNLEDVTVSVGNLLMTAGATALWNGLTSAGLGTPFNSTNAQIAVGDSSTAASAGQTDLQAAAGSTQNTGDISAATNATPIVLTVPSWTVQPVVGQVVVVAGVLGNTAANGTFEVQAVSSTTLTLKNSAGNGAFSASAGSTVKIINKYRQTVNGSPTVSTNQGQFVSVFGTPNANFQWNEWGITTGGGATNPQAVPPPTLFNRSATNTITKTSSVTVTATMSATIS